jgi:hypothetical protein
MEKTLVSAKDQEQAKAFVALVEGKLKAALVSSKEVL